jgi:hypothetical protein
VFLRRDKAASSPEAGLVTVVVIGGKEFNRALGEQRTIVRHQESQLMLESEHLVVGNIRITIESAETWKKGDHIVRKSDMQGIKE